MRKVLTRESKYTSSLEERLRKIQAELDSIDERIEALSRETKSSFRAQYNPVQSITGHSDIQYETKGSSENSQPQTYTNTTTSTSQKTVSSHNVQSLTSNIPESRVGNERFTEYLAKNFGVERRLRNEERIRRNQAIVITIAAIMALLWLISKIYGF